MVASALLTATDRFVSVATLVALVSMGIVSLVSIVMMFTLPGKESEEAKLDVSGSAIVILLMFTVAFTCFVFIVFRRIPG